MASLLSKEPVYRKEDCLLIDIGTVYRVISVICSFTDAEKCGFIESVWKPDLLFELPVSIEVDRNLWKSAKVSTEPSRKLNNPECFQLWLTRQRTFQTKKLKPSIVLRYVDSSKSIREEFSGVRRC